MARRVLNHCVGGSLFCGSPCCGSPCCGSLCCGSLCCGYPVVVHCVVVTLLWVNVPTPPRSMGSFPKQQLVIERKLMQALALSIQRDQMFQLPPITSLKH